MDRRRYQVGSLFNATPKTIGGVKDLFMRVTRQILGSNEERRCDLCGHKSDSFHLFLKCPIVEQFEKRIDPSGELMKKRREKCLMPNSEDFTWAWLMNWAIWKLFSNVLHSEDIGTFRATWKNSGDEIDRLLNPIRGTVVLKDLMPKLTIQLEFLMKCSEKDHLISKLFSRTGVKSNHFIGLRYFKSDGGKGFVRREGTVD